MTAVAAIVVSRSTTFPNRRLGQMCADCGTVVAPGESLQFVLVRTADENDWPVVVNGRSPLVCGVCADDSPPGARVLVSDGRVVEDDRFRCVHVLDSGRRCRARTTRVGAASRTCTAHVPACEVVHLDFIARRAAAS